jgi:hypothetical protein
MLNSDRFHGKHLPVVILAGKFRGAVESEILFDGDHV